MSHIALITGGARGIGLGISTALARDGWSLALCGLRLDREVADTLAQLTSIGAPEVAYWTCNIADRDERTRLIGEVTARFGKLDALVNNAGKAPAVRADILEATEQSFEDLIRTNLQGPYFLTQAAVPLLRAARTGVAADARPKGGVVFVTSVSAEMASLNRGDYCVSKAGLAMATQLFALRLAAEGIGVFEVRPGIIATDMTAKVKEIYDQRIADGLVPEGRWGYPNDVGRTVAALLRGDVPYATGSVIHVAGGLQIGRL